SITIPTGSFEIEQINSRIQQLIKDNGDGTPISISVYKPTSQTILDIVNGSAGSVPNTNYSVDFTKPNSIRTILGFESKKYSQARNLSENTIKIELTNDINIHCNLITSNS